MIFHLKISPEIKQNLRLCIENQGSNFLDLSPAGLVVTEEQAIGMRADILWQMARNHMSVGYSDGPGKEVENLTRDEFEQITVTKKKLVSLEDGEEPPIK